MITLSVFVAAVMSVVALLHFYWAFGGKYGLASAGPKLEGEKQFIPSGKLIFIVACLMLALAVLPIQLVTPLQIFENVIAYVGFIVAVVFIIRGVGDFKYVGLFKKVYNSNFARLDTRYFSPLIIVLGISYAVLSMYGT
jgi:fatty acid desaturase